MDNFHALAELLFSDIHDTPEKFEEMYPERQLPEGARVTRFAPSPTGYMHIGGMYQTLIDIFTAKVSGGVSFLRIEDTDSKRELGDAVAAIIDGLKAFEVEFDEGVTGFGEEKGDYGPYTQSRRVEIYHTVAKSLVEKGLAYPCFCTADELSALRENQEKEGTQIWGYFGKWARCRDLSLDEIKQNLSEGKPYVLRFRSDGDENKRIVFEDFSRGKIEMPENIIDEVLLKSDGIPTYHFAHVCDDHFMRTTHVIRGEEWISSVPKHIALFKACGYKPPKYTHTPQIMKTDEESGAKRKLSKRKDPEAAVSFFVEAGYPCSGVKEYLMTVISSAFEDWRRANKDAPLDAFPFNLKKMSSSGALFDMAKMNDVCKNIISKMSADKVYSETLAWARANDDELYSLFSANPDYAKSLLNIDRETAKPRKDIAKWSDVKQYAEYFYDGLYCEDFTLPENICRQDAADIIKNYLEVFDANDDKDTWFAKIKELCEPLGFTPNVKEYKQNPDAFKGHVGDVSTVIRIALTSRTNTPDLHAVSALLGNERARARLNSFLSSLSD